MFCGIAVGEITGLASGIVWMRIMGSKDTGTYNEAVDNRYIKKLLRISTIEDDDY